MKLCIVASGLLFSCLVAAAAPPVHALRSSERRQAGRRSGLRARDSGSDIHKDDQGWAGAIHSGKDITEVSASFVLPKLSRPSNAEAGKTYTGSAWVGIDGDDNCPGQIIQAGVDFRALPNGEAQYAPWAEWFPGAYFPFDDLKDLKAGDEVHFQVKTDGTNTGGTATFSVPATGESWTHTWKDQPALCQSSAEWVMENLLDYDENQELVVQPLVVFSDLTFTEAKYTHDGGVQSGSAGSKTNAIKIGGVVRADGEVVGDDSVVVKYIRSV